MFQFNAHSKYGIKNWDNWDNFSHNCLWIVSGKFYLLLREYLPYVLKVLTDDKLFWRKISPLFTEKKFLRTLRKHFKKDMRTGNAKIAQTFNTFFRNIIDKFNIERDECISCDTGNEADPLTIPTGKDWCFTQFSTEMVGWLLLIFLICLHNQLSYTYIHSIISTDVWKLLFIK